VSTASSPPNTPELWFTERDLEQNVGYSLRIRRHVHSEQSPLQHIDLFIKGDKLDSLYNPRVNHRRPVRDWNSYPIAMRE